MHLIAAPTMRVPLRLERSINPYLAARAALLLVAHGVFRAGSKEGTPVRNAVTTVAFPGLGTGVGHVPSNVCPRQVRAAIIDVTLGQGKFPQSLSEVQDRHHRMYTEFTEGQNEG